ncbi:MAG: hypothetical protein ACRCZ9_03060 [Fusobacteriaceae bacterium]
MSFKFEMPESLSGMMFELKELRLTVNKFENKDKLFAYINNIENLEISEEMMRTIIDQFKDSENQFFLIANENFREKIINIFEKYDGRKEFGDYETRIKIYLSLYSDDCDRNIKFAQLLTTSSDKIDENSIYSYLVNRSSEIFKYQCSGKLTSKFPLEFGVKYPLVEKFLMRAERESKIDVFEEWVLRIWGRERKLDDFSSELKTDIIKFTPEKLIKMLESDNIEIEKIEKKKNYLLIKVPLSKNKSRYIQIEEESKNIKYSLLDEKKNKIDRGKDKKNTRSLFYLRRTMVEEGYKFKIEEIIKKIIKICKIIAVISIGILILMILVTLAMYYMEHKK